MTDKIFTQKQIFDNDTDKHAPPKRERWKAKTWEHCESDFANEQTLTNQPEQLNQNLCQEKWADF